MSDLFAFQKRIEYEFKDIELLKNSLTHSSYAKSDKHNAKHNERLEFLGDAVLELCISNYLFSISPELDEGEMTRMRSSLVCESALYDAASKIGLNDQLFLSHGEETGGGRSKPSIVSDAFEALIGAIYVDGGFESAQKFVMSYGPSTHKDILFDNKPDCKTHLQEWLQREGSVNIRYEVIDTSGPDHNKHFKVRVLANGNQLGVGCGPSKKEAEQDAAKSALSALGVA